MSDRSGRALRSRIFTRKTVETVQAEALSQGLKRSLSATNLVFLGVGCILPFTGDDIAPEALALEHRSLIRGRKARALVQALAAVDRDRLMGQAPELVRWERAAWAEGRADIWKPNS